MDAFNESANGIKLLLFEALESENNSTKFEAYKKYLKGLGELFIFLNKDLENFSYGDDINNLNTICQRHYSMVKSASHCINRSLELLEVEPRELKEIRRGSVLDNSNLDTCIKSLDYKSMPAKKSIDFLLSEKPRNPIDSAKFNLQSMVNNTKKLLQSQKLTASQRASVQLQLNRVVEETLSIARKRESDICKTKTSDLELLMQGIDNDISHFTILRGDSEMNQVYRSSLLFYHHILKDSKWFQLTESDRCPESSCISFILRMNDNHPIVEYIERKIGHLLSIEYNKDDASMVLNEIKKFMEDIEKLSMVCCLIGNFRSPQRNYNASQTLFGLFCEFIFAKRNVAKYLYDFLFLSDENSLKQYNENVQLVQENFDVSVILPEKFSKHPSVIIIIDDTIDKFNTLRNFYNPLERTTKLCEIIRNMMSVITEKNPKVEIGADELVPILSYMMIKFDNAEIYLHVKYLEILMPSDYMIGIEGYILVSVCCAMAFCTSDKFGSYLPSNKT